MESLGRKVKEDDVVIGEKILKVDGSLNRQVGVKLMNDVDKTFYESFRDAGITRALTIEASGIAPVIMASFRFGTPCLFAKKAKPSTLKDGFYSTDIRSSTENKTNTITVSEEFLGVDDKVLIIDDFLASDDALLGLNGIVKQTNATIVGMGIVVEKSFQNDHQRLGSAGLCVPSLCKVASLKGDKVTLLSEA